MFDANTMMTITSSMIAGCALLVGFVLSVTLVKKVLKLF